MAQRGSPGILPGVHLFRYLPAACWRGGRTGPQQRTSRNSCVWQKLFGQSDTSMSAFCFRAGLGVDAPSSRPRFGVLARGYPAGCRVSRVGPWMARCGVPLASAPKRGHPERQRRANGGAATPRPARKQNLPHPGPAPSQHHISTWVPNSITRLSGKLKNRRLPLAFLSMKANNASRQRAIPTILDAITVSRLRK